MVVVVAALGTREEQLAGLAVPQWGAVCWPGDGSAGLTTVYLEPPREVNVVRSLWWWLEVVVFLPLCRLVVMPLQVLQAKLCPHRYYRLAFTHNAGQTR